MSTPSPATGDAPATTTGAPRPPLDTAKKSALPPITGGQRASAILAGISGHILFAIGWFGIAFVLLGPLVSGLINDLLGNLLGGDSYAQDFTAILARGGALLWLFGLVFLVGSVAFGVFGVIASLLILRRGSVDKPGRVNWPSFVIAALLDLPIFLVTLWLATVITDNSAGLLWLPPLLGLILAAVIGVVIWWLMAVANRGPATPRTPKPPKVGKTEGSPGAA